MRRHAKAATAGSNRPGASKRKPGLLLICLAACVAALAVVVGSASASKTHLFKEAFGPAAQPSFTTPRGMAIDQGSGEVYVIDAGSPPSVKRFNEDGTASNFSALSSNAIDGAGGADETPQGSLAFGAANRVQIAIDESGTATDGDIYVAQQSSKLLDVFDSTGTYKGQLTESSEGLLGEICGVAVDSAGKLYLGDIAGKVHVYEPAANPPVNGDSSANFATVAAPCQIAAGSGATAGFLFVNRSNGELKKVDAATGEVKYAIGSTSHRTVYVNPATGHVYAPRQTGSNSEVVEYDASGAASATTVSSFKPGSTIEGIAVRASDANVLITRSGQANAQLYGATVTQPDVTSTAVSNNTGTRATLNGTVNPDGVELSECFFEWSLFSGSFENTAPCAESNATIGAGTSPVAVHADLSGLTPQSTQYKYRLVAKNPETPAVTGSQQSFNTPNTVTTTAATGTTPTSTTLNGTVNPDTVAITECVFEWGPEKGLNDEFQEFPETAPCVPGPGGIGTGTSLVAVSAELTGLHPGATYVYRLKAANADGPIKVAGQLSVLTTGPTVAAAWSADVVFQEATLRAQINPRGSATTYRFEYGPTAAYGSETEELSVGSDSSLHTVARYLEGLSPGTAYHYRVVATSGVAVSEGPDQIFTTFAPVPQNTDCPNQAYRTGAAASLPDCRAYEMVSPVDKNGGDAIQPFHGSFQSTADGGKITYSSVASFGDQVSSLFVNQYIASRGATGWSNHGVNPPHGRTLSTGFSSYDDRDNSLLFSADLTSHWLRDNSFDPLAPGGAPDLDNLYRRDDQTGSFEALTSAPSIAGPVLEPEINGHSADFSQILFTVQGALTSDANPGARRQVYDYADGQLHLVSVLPDGSPSTLENAGGFRGFGGDLSARYENSMSEDGSRVYWNSELGTGTAQTVYLRENPDQSQSALNGGGECTEPAKACTIKVLSGAARFWGASLDGSRALVMQGGDEGGSSPGDLYEFDADTRTATLVVPEANGVVGYSDDLSYLYVVSFAALTPDALSGQRNLYLLHEGTPELIGTVSYDDSHGSNGFGSTSRTTIDNRYISDRSSRVTPSGRFLLFESSRPLTGYDNTDAHSGEADREVFLFDAVANSGAGELRCVSCNPSGTRPEGANFGFELRTNQPTWTASWIDPRRSSFYSSHVLSDSGDRVFFNSFDALVPGDGNGALDVYGWEAPGSGDCEVGGARYSATNGGCVSLVSSGQSTDGAHVVDVTPDGSDVFISTRGSLLPQDPGLVDLYDARVEGGFEPPAPTPPECLGDSCQAPAAPPQVQTPASAAFRGPGAPGTARNCAPAARRALILSRRAKRLRQAARQSQSARRSKALRRRSARLAKRAKGMSRRATRCRRVNRGAGR